MPAAHDALQEKILAQYAAEHVALGQAGTLALLAQGRRWELAPTLAAGGIIVFPHTSVADCGHQVAAAVHAALDTLRCAATYVGGRRTGRVVAQALACPAT